MADSPLVAFRLNEESERILDALTEAEGRSRSDVMRRALRLYGEHAGIVQRKAKPKRVAVDSPKPRPTRRRAT